MSANFSSLPEEIVEIILAKLPAKDAMSSRQVCSLWNTIIMDPQRKICNEVTLYLDLNSVSEEINTNQEEIGIQTLEEKMLDELEQIWQFFDQNNFKCAMVVKNWKMRDMISGNGITTRREYAKWFAITAKLEKLFRFLENIKLVKCEICKSIWGWLFSQCALKSLHLRETDLNFDCLPWFRWPSSQENEEVTLTKLHLSNCMFWGLENCVKMDWLQLLTHFEYDDEEINNYTAIDVFLSEPFNKIPSLPHLTHFSFCPIRIWGVEDGVNYLRNLFENSSVRSVSLFEREEHHFETLKKRVEIALPYWGGFKMVRESSNYISYKSKSMDVQCKLQPWDLLRLQMLALQ